MNPNPKHYGTLPACQALAKAGIVMETDCCRDLAVNPDKVIHWPKGVERNHPDFVPAPSLAEMWRELPHIFTISGCLCTLGLSKEREDMSVAVYSWHGDWLMSIRHSNPTDALIYLRIWLEERGKII
jgi:hypothetical protein